ncbi:MAG: creatininase family protein [Chloroflexaceae bacterium]|nr:creatininase family protein [Chloroflexaceae bacterium]
MHSIDAISHTSATDCRTEQEQPMSQAPDKKPWGRYAEMRPQTLASVRSQAPIIYMPYGALQWHGAHLPLGTDGITAEAIAEQTVQRTGGVLMPTTWWPAIETPHDNVIAARSNVVAEMWSDIFDGLALIGWRLVVVVNGHPYRDHELMLITAAEQAMQRHKMLVLAVSPLALLDNNLIDHGALWETSLMLSISPAVVDIYALGEDELALERNSVRGRDPRGAASPSLGDTLLRMAVERLASAIGDLLRYRDQAPLFALYEQRRESLMAFANNSLAMASPSQQAGDEAGSPPPQNRPTKRLDDTRTTQRLTQRPTRRLE